MVGHSDRQLELALAEQAHVGDLITGPDEFGIEDGLDRLDHCNSLFGSESGKKALHDLFDFSDVLLHDDRDVL